MDAAPHKKTLIPNWLKLLLKIAVTIAGLWYVFTKIDVREIGAAIAQADLRWLIAAFVIYALSKFTGSLRLNIYFKNIGIQLPTRQNIKLYWLGMFYNLFLPGAVTGDAYKVILLSKRFQIPYKKTAMAVLLDRFSGLLSLGLIVAAYSALVVRPAWIVITLIFGAILLIPLLWVLMRRFFMEFLPGFWSTFLLGAIVQLTVLACVYCVLFALNVTADINSYVFIFLVAVTASVLPISVGGGLGVREFVIIEGAKYAGLGTAGQHTALLVSLLFYAVTVVCSLIGMIFVFKNPLTDSVNNGVAE